MKSWNEYFLDLAKTCASRSNCIRAQVGAVIVGEDKKIKATGYNGTPSKVESCYERGECYRIKHNIPSGTRYETCRSIHAEQNAIIQAGRIDVKGLQCIFGDTISSVFYARDLLFRPELKMYIFKRTKLRQ